MRAILLVRDERVSRDADPELLEAATAEVLRTLVLAADAVLIPASADVLSLATVIARGVVRPAPDAERAIFGSPERLPTPGRFIPFAVEEGSRGEALAVLMHAYLGPPM